MNGKFSFDNIVNSVSLSKVKGFFGRGNKTGSGIPEEKDSFFKFLYKLIRFHWKLASFVSFILFLAGEEIFNPLPLAIYQSLQTYEQSTSSGVYFSNVRYQSFGETQLKPKGSPVTGYLYNSGPYSTFNRHATYESVLSPVAVDILPFQDSNYEKYCGKNCNIKEYVTDGKVALRSIMSGKVIYKGFIGMTRTWNPDIGAFTNPDGSNGCWFIPSSASTGFGNVVFVANEEGWVTVFFHLDEYAPGLKLGQDIKYGDLIGYMGNTGCSSTKHLHFEIRKGDPLKDLSVFYNNKDSSQNVDSPYDLPAMGYYVVPEETYWEIFQGSSTIENGIAYLEGVGPGAKRGKLNQAPGTLTPDEFAKVAEQGFSFSKGVSYDLFNTKSKDCGITNYYIPMYQAPLDLKSKMDINIQGKGIVQDGAEFKLYSYNSAGWKTDPILRSTYPTFEEASASITGAGGLLGIGDLACPKEFRFGEMIIFELQGGKKQIFRCMDRGAYIKKFTTIESGNKQSIWTFDIFSGIGQGSLDYMRATYPPIGPQVHVIAGKGPVAKTITKCYFEKAKGK